MKTCYEHPQFPQPCPICQPADFKVMFDAYGTVADLLGCTRQQAKILIIKKAYETGRLIAPPVEPFYRPTKGRYAWFGHDAQPTCQVPPLGWSCTRESGHDGPCAAVPVKLGLLTRLRRWIRETDWLSAISYGSFYVLCIIALAATIWLAAQVVANCHKNTCHDTAKVNW